MSERLTIKQAAVAFGVTSVTIFAWRKGIGGREPLPVETDMTDEWKLRPRVYVPVGAARQWAVKYRLAFDPKLAADAEEFGRSTKPGPKPKARKSRKAQQPH